ncbi:unnamed protein product [Amoebophrya sp. A25]|nr:unnamed protein product [Amoebophrya sp. A25]|eukprot:GSA25T00003708001.1
MVKLIIRSLAVIAAAAGVSGIAVGDNNRRGKGSVARTEQHQVQQQEEAAKNEEPKKEMKKVEEDAEEEDLKDLEEEEQRFNEKHRQRAAAYLAAYQREMRLTRAVNDTTAAPGNSTTAAPAKSGSLRVTASMVATTLAGVYAGVQLLF